MLAKGVLGSHWLLLFHFCWEKFTHGNNCFHCRKAWEIVPTTNQWWLMVGWDLHYGDVITGVTASQITSLTIVYWTIYSDADQRKHQSSASLAFVWGIHRGPVNSPHKWPVTRKHKCFHLMTSSCRAYTSWHHFRYHVYGTKFYIKMQCNSDKKYVNSNRKFKRF